MADDTEEMDDTKEVVVRDGVTFPTWLAGAMVVVAALAIGAIGYAIGSADSNNGVFDPVADVRGAPGPGSDLPGGMDEMQGRRGPHGGPGGMEGRRGPGGDGGPGRGGPHLRGGCEKGDDERRQGDQEDGEKSDGTEEDAGEGNPAVPGSEGAAI
jgi:hypothetical protein